MPDFNWSADLSGAEFRKRAARCPSTHAGVWLPDPAPLCGGQLRRGDTRHKSKVPFSFAKLGGANRDIGLAVGMVSHPGPMLFISVASFLFSILLVWAIFRSAICLLHSHVALWIGTNPLNLLFQRATGSFTIAASLLSTYLNEI